jgi:D-inositol-3-phosphate glycosyltransferase
VDERQPSPAAGVARSGGGWPAPSRPDIEVGVLTGGFDKPYVLGLATALMARGVRLEVVGGDDVDSPELHASPAVTFLNLRPSRRGNIATITKIWHMVRYYVRLIGYAATARPTVLHILWNNKFQLVDRTLLMLYYKLLGKKIALTAHNVNAGKRDANDSWLNRLTLRIQYRLADRIFVHTEQMKGELVDDFGVPARAVAVIPFGINTTVANTDLTPAQARARLGIAPGERAILFFGNIRPYKGLDLLVAAFQRLAAGSSAYRLVIAGEPRDDCAEYLAAIQQAIGRDPHRERIIQHLRFIPDEETELYFKAADVLVLPYREVFQSGVLFLGYGFGLPVVAADVGALRDDVIEARTGFLCAPDDPDDLSRAIERYFDSDLYRNLATSRRDIRAHAGARNSWDVVADISREVYADMLGHSPS